MSLSVCGCVPPYASNQNRTSKLRANFLCTLQLSMAVALVLLMQPWCIRTDDGAKTRRAFRIRDVAAECAMHHCLLFMLDLQQTQTPITVTENQIISHTTNCKCFKSFTVIKVHPNNTNSQNIVSFDRGSAGNLFQTAWNGLPFANSLIRH